MRSAKVLYKGVEAGILIQHDDGAFVFRYHDSWFVDKSKPSISLTLSKKQQEYSSEYLFSFFYNMLPEGANKQMLCQSKRVDKSDDFGLLLASAGVDTIGAVKVVKMN